MTSITSNSTGSEHFIDLLPAYVNGTLSPAERSRVTGHVRRCTPCRVRLLAWEAISAASKGVFPYARASDTDARAMVRAALARAASSHGRSESRGDEHRAVGLDPTKPKS